MLHRPIHLLYLFTKIVFFVSSLLNSLKLLCLWIELSFPSQEQAFPKNINETTHASKHAFEE